MMSVLEPIVGASACSLCGVIALRAAWGRAHRSLWLNSAGWALLLGGAIGGWIIAGAWGMSIVSLFAMTAAFAVLGWSGVRSMPGKQKASNRRARMLPEKGEPLWLGRRLATFALVGVAAALVALGLSIATCWLGMATGWSEANCNASALLVMPLAWATIAFAVLMQPYRSQQLKVIAAASLPVWPVLAARALS